MAPRGAAVHRRRHRGELGHLTHCLTDGIGGCLAIVEAACGYDAAIDWPAAGSRRRWRALREDARQTMRDIPSYSAAPPSPPHDSPGEPAAMPQRPPPPPPSGRRRRRTHHSPNGNGLHRCRRVGRPRDPLGGTSNGCSRVWRPASPSAWDELPQTARSPGAACQRARGRRHPRQRHHDVDITVDPAPATTDLRDIRAAIKQALIRHREVPDERQVLLPLVPLLPQAAGQANGQRGRRRRDQSLSHPTWVRPTAAVYRPDGTAADHFAMLSRCQGVTEAMMDRLGGLLVLLSG